MNASGQALLREVDDWFSLGKFATVSTGFEASKPKG
jgi:hypothetical protein